MTAETSSTARSSRANPRRRRLRSSAVIGAVAIVAIFVATLLLRAKHSDDELRRRASEFASAKRWDRAVESLGQLSSPNSGDILLQCSAQLALKNYKVAKADLNRIPETGPWAAQRYLVLGQIDQAEFRARPMEAHLLKAIELEPNHVAARRLLVYLFGVQERRQELLEQFAKLVEIGPLTVDLVLHWSISRGRIGDPTDGVRDLSRFVAADPDDRTSRLALAEASRRLGKLDQALEAISPLAADDTDARALRAQLAFDRGDNAEGDALLAGAPADHAALNRLRGRRALARRDARSAVEFLTAAEASDSNQLETIFQLAQALRLDGKKVEADRLAARAIAHQSLRSMLAEFSNSQGAPRLDTFKKIAVACERVGFMPEAIAWYRLAVTADVLDSDAQKAIYRLKSKH